MLIWLSLKLQKIHKYTYTQLYIYTYISSIIFIIIHDNSRASQEFFSQFAVAPLIGFFLV